MAASIQAEIEFKNAEIFCTRCGEQIPDVFEVRPGRKVPLLTCMACLPMAPAQVPKRRTPKPGIGGLLDNAPSIFIGRNG